MNFFIFTHPRCRSLWLANLLTTNNSLCIHDTQGCLVKQTRDRLLNCGHYPYIGLSEPTPTVFRSIDTDVLERSPKVVIQTSIDDSYQRTKKWIGDTPHRWGRDNAQRQAEALAEIEKMPNCISVPFYSIDDQAEIIFRHCLPGLVFDPIRAKLLRDMIITVPYPKHADGFMVMHRRQLVAHSLV